MELCVSMIVGIVLILRIVKKYWEFVKRVVIVVGMDWIVIIVSNNEDCGKI